MNNPPIVLCTMHIMMEIIKINPKNNKKFLTLLLSLMLKIILIFELKNDKIFLKSMISPIKVLNSLYINYYMLRYIRKFSLKIKI